MARYTHYIFDDIEIANSSMQNTEAHIKKTYDSDQDSTFDNPNYLEAASKDWYLENKVDVKVIYCLNETQRLIGKEYSLSDQEKTELLTYRSDLWDLRSTIETNNFSDLSFPSKPTWYDQKINELKTRGLL